MKPYLLFANDYYYPEGGWDDYRGDFESVDAAAEYVPHVAAAERISNGWWHVVDINSRSVVAKGRIAAESFKP